MEALLTDPSPHALPLSGSKDITQHIRPFRSTSGFSSTRGGAPAHVPRPYSAAKSILSEKLS